MPFEARFLASEAEAPLLLQSETIDAYIDGSSVEAVFENSDFVKVSGYYPLRYSPLALTTARPELKPFIDVMRYQTTGKAAFSGLRSTTARYGRL